MQIVPLARNKPAACIEQMKHASGVTANCGLKRACWRGLRRNPSPASTYALAMQQQCLHVHATWGSSLRPPRPCAPHHAQTRLPRARAPCPRQRRRARGPRQRLCRVLRAPPRRARSALRAVRLRPLALPPCSGHAKSATKSEPSKRVCAGDATAVSTCACNLGLKAAPAASLCSSALQRACQISEKKIPEKTSRLAPTRRDAPEGAGRL